ncbi:hypothetical protein CDL12_28895 [Handroanthus impetiginosus]|uniref:F-box domain-containing protein n=1 Tax=Handroanthus impetiginosus TaxID=429701 RepID=A0A2G9G0F7_9LAMI|nr:hypothetical protein CDL12_28895 [Handroanthus impetiginosus]
MKPITPSHDLSYDIIFSILLRSTVKSLLRFTCISKSINALIRSSAFVAAHHHNKIHNNENNISDFYIVYMPNDDRKDQELCSLKRDINAPSQKYNLLFPFRFYNLVGVCEGLICFAKDSNVYIWNPFVGSMKIVPPSGSVNDDVIYRFHFAKRSCDYKVIKQSTNANNSLITLEIYSLEKDSWRRIEYKHPDYFIHIRMQLLFKRFIYWMGASLSSRSTSLKALIKFDLDEEIFEEVTGSELCDNKLKYSLFFSDTWNGVPEGNQDHILSLIYQARVSILKDHYLVPIKGSLMLLDQKDKNGLINCYN